jgi:hypothetical protein
LSYISDVADQIRQEVPPDTLPEDGIDELFLIYAVLTLTVGEGVQPRHVHDAWSAWMTGRDPTHSSVKPFEDLDAHTKMEDQPYVEAIRKVASRLSHNVHQNH